jgi:hypothetical protein
MAPAVAYMDEVIWVELTTDLGKSINEHQGFVHHVKLCLLKLFDTASDEGNASNSLNKVDICRRAKDV